MKERRQRKGIEKKKKKVNVETAEKEMNPSRSTALGRIE